MPKIDFSDVGDVAGPDQFRAQAGDGDYFTTPPLHQSGRPLGTE